MGHRMSGERAPQPAAAVYSCVVDSDRGFHLDVLRWFATLTTVAAVSAEDLVVHTIGDSPTDALEYLRRRGVAVRQVEAFDARSPHCNKIAGALALASQDIAERLVVLTDTDVAIARDLVGLQMPEWGIRAKLVDAPNPPLEVLERVFAAADLQLPQAVPPDFDRSAPTIATNFNGGVYVLPGALLPGLADAWARWARWLLDQDLLGDRSFFTDQVAMALAIAERGDDISPLTREWNFPTHVAEWIAEPAEAPAVVHYHGCVDPTGLISATGSQPVDEVIARLNLGIAEIWHDAFPNRTFWDWRYKNDPSLGSGVGSRGEPLKGKRRLLKDVVARVRPATVLDVGCGDGEATRGLPLAAYIGLDLSEEAIRLARLTRPDGTFELGTIRDWRGEAELILCLDVLIHQADAEEYRATVKALLDATTRVLLVSGYERPPESDSPMVHFHEPLSSTVARAAPAVSRRTLREVHDITTLAVIKPPFDRNWPHRSTFRLSADRLRSIRHN